MAKLVWVGLNPKNKGGSSAKAYTVRRLGRTVLTKYGRIDVVGSAGGKYYWRHVPTETRETFRTETAAAEKVREIIQQKRNKRYDLLPGRVPIRPPRPKAR